MICQKLKIGPGAILQLVKAQLMLGLSFFNPGKPYEKGDKQINNGTKPEGIINR